MATNLDRQLLTPELTKVRHAADTPISVMGVSYNDLCG